MGRKIESNQGGCLFLKNVKAPLCFDGLEAGDEFCGGLGRTVEQLGLPLGILGMLLEPGTNVMK
jgi:hypothetical protein